MSSATTQRKQGAGQGCEVPAFAGTTERARTLTLTLSQRERGFARLRGNDGFAALGWLESLGRRRSRR